MMAPRIDAMKLNIGKNLTMPLDVATESLACLGRKSSGKTYTASVLAEEMLEAGIQVVILDPTDVWYGLRSDGKGGGYPIIVCGGRHGDVPLEASSGRVMAEFVVQSGSSVLLSTRKLSKGDQRRFVGDFAERLWELKDEDRVPLHLFIDECDRFVPQRPVPGGERAYGAIDTLVRLGRSSGVGTTLISQRAAVIAKDVLTQTEILVCHQTTGPQDRKALETWIEANADDAHKKEFLGSLASLKRGEAWFWSPSTLDIFQRTQVRKRKTYDSSSTPKVGERRIEPKQLAPVDLDKLKAQIAETIERAKADDPKALRAEIAKLKTELGSGGKQFNAALQAEIQRLVENVRMLQCVIPATTKLVDKLEKVRDALSEAMAEFRNTNASVQSLDAKVQNGKPPLKRATFSRAPAPSDELMQLVSERGFKAGQASVPIDLPKGEREIMLAIAQRHPQTTSKQQAALLTGYSVRSGHFANMLGKLRSKGWIEGTGDALRLTGDAWEKAHPFIEPPRTGGELLTFWMGHSAVGSARNLLEVLYGSDGMSREILAKATGYSATSGHFANMLGKLRSLELIKRGDPIELNEAFNG